MITEPAVYQQGEEIKFRNRNGGIISLEFFEGTQLLQGISGRDIADKDVAALQQKLKSYLGKPFDGYEATRQCIMPLGSYPILEFEYGFLYNPQCNLYAAASSNGVTAKGNGSYIPTYTFFLRLDEISSMRTYKQGPFDSPKAICNVRTKEIF